MNEREIVLEAIKEVGTIKAENLRNNSANMTGTEIIEQEVFIPQWRNDADYTNAKIGTPVIDNEQVFGLLQPHNASHYPFRPIELPSLWRIKHTTDPTKAKPWVKPTSTSDMYLKDECMIWEDNSIMRALRDTVYSPVEHLPDWEVVEI